MVHGSDRSPVQNGQNLEALEQTLVRKISISNKQLCPKPCVYNYMNDVWVLLRYGAPRHVGLKYKTEKQMYEELKFAKTRVESVKRRDCNGLLHILGNCAACKCLSV